MFLSFLYFLLLASPAPPRNNSYGIQSNSKPVVKEKVVEEVQEEEEIPQEDPEDDEDEEKDAEETPSKYFLSLWQMIDCFR